MPTNECGLSLAKLPVERVEPMAREARAAALAEADSAFDEYLCHGEREYRNRLAAEVERRNASVWRRPMLGLGRWTTETCPAPRTVPLAELASKWMVPHRDFDANYDDAGRMSHLIALCATTVQAGGAEVWVTTEDAAVLRRYCKESTDD